MFEGLLQPTHLILILLICMLLFGGKKLPEVGRGLGEAINGFRKAMKDGSSDGGDSGNQSIPPSTGSKPSN